MCMDCKHCSCCWQDEGDNSPRCHYERMADWDKAPCEYEDEPDDDLDYMWDDDRYIPSSTHGDYSPSNPWDAPGMSVSDFI